jgi:hypothetical protein
LRAAVDALVRDLNRRGGLAGRPVKPVVIADKLNPNASVADVQTLHESDCAKMTEDEHVFAVVAMNSAALAENCYAQHHTPVFVRSIAELTSAAHLRALAPWVIPDDTPDLDDEARIQAAALGRQHFAHGRIGIMAPDLPDVHPVVQQVLIPRLRAQGATVDQSDVYYVEPDMQHGPKTAANAALRWKTDDVGHVVLFALGAPAWNYVANEDESVGLKPIYGLDSVATPQFALDLNPQNAQTPTIPADQRRAVAAGFFPVFDVHDDDYPLRPVERSCLRVVNRADGTNYRHRNFGTGGGILMACRQLQLLERVFAPFIGRPVDPTQLYAAWQSLGSSYRPPDLPRAVFGPGHVEGATVYRVVVYNHDCDCMRYDSRWLPAPTGTP